MYFRYSKRTSSARWDEDQLSLVEKRTYRSQMGLRPSLAPASLGAGAAQQYQQLQHHNIIPPNATSHRQISLVTGTLLR